MCKSAKLLVKRGAVFCGCGGWRADPVFHAIFPPVPPSNYWQWDPWHDNCMTRVYIFVRHRSCIPCAGAHVTPMCGILVQCAPILVHFSFLVTPKTWESFSHVSQTVRNSFLTTKSRTYPVDNLCLSVSQTPYKIYMRNFARRDCISLQSEEGSQAQL